MHFDAWECDTQHWSSKKGKHWETLIDVDYLDNLTLVNTNIESSRSFVQLCMESCKSHLFFVRFALRKKYIWLLHSKVQLLGGEDPTWTQSCQCPVSEYLSPVKCEVSEYLSSVNTSVKCQVSRPVIFFWFKLRLLRLPVVSQWEKNGRFWCWPGEAEVCAIARKV